MKKIVFFIVLLSGFSAFASATTCLDAFPGGTSENQNGSVFSDEALAQIPWQNNPWPWSGTVLDGGYYYFSGASFGNSYTLHVASGERVVIYVNGSLAIWNNLSINEFGSPEQLVLVVNGSLYIHNNAVINGFVFVAGAINVNNNNLVVGGVASNGPIDKDNNNEFNYDADAAAEIELPGLCEPQPPVLEAHYPLDLCEDLSTGLIEDLVGNYPANGYLLGSSGGKVNNAADLSGSGNDYVDLPAALLDGLEDFSIGMWVRPDAKSGFRELVSAFNAATDNELELYIRQSNEVRAAIKGNYYAFSSPTPYVSNGDWQHLVLVRSDEELCLYLNGEPSACTAANDQPLSISGVTLGVWKKADGSLSDEYNGDIDEVMVYSGALSPQQIRRVYEYQNAGKDYDGSIRGNSCLSCISDDFGRTSLGSEWRAYKSYGNFTPALVNGRLRMTEAVSDQATSVTYQKLLPAAKNLVLIEFDYYAYGGSGADGMAVVLSDATKTPDPGAFGGPLGYGYKPGIPGFNGGWLGIGIDEFGNFSSQGGDTGPGFRPQSVAIRGSGSGTSGYRYLKGTCNNGITSILGGCLFPFVDATTSDTPHRYRIAIDSRTEGSTFVQIQRDSGSGYQTLIDWFNAADPAYLQDAVPENFLLSLTGSTGDLTNIHELDNIQICAIKSVPISGQIDHFEISHASNTVRCLSSLLEVKACRDSDCSNLYTQPISLTLGVDQGNFSGGEQLALIMGEGSTKLRNPIGGLSTVSVVDSSVQPNNPVECKVGTQQSNCQIEFTDAGLAFFAADGNAPPSDMIAGVDQSAVLRAVKSDNSGACQARVEGSQTVELGFECRNPGACIAGQNFTINGQDSGANNFNQSTNRFPVDLAFDATGSAPLTLNYTDVGELVLHASLYVPAEGEEPATSLHGSSVPFVATPHTLKVSAVPSNPASTSSGNGFMAAGESFAVEATSFNANGVITPNFGNETTPQRVEIKTATTVYPAGGVSGLLQQSEFVPVSGGVQRDTGVKWHEAGSMQVSVGLVGDSYLGVADTSNKPQSETIGRFYPYNLVRTEDGISEACVTFSYMEQDAIHLDYRIEAQGKNGNVLLNYDNTELGYAGTAVFALAARNQVSGSEAINLGPRFVVPDTGVTWDDGAFSYTSDLVAFSRKADQAADGPYEDLQVGLKIVSEIDSRDLATLNMNESSNATDCSAGCDAMAFSENLAIRYGRLVLANAFGPEDENLPLQLSAEYWNGTRFVGNALDYCTTFNASALTIEDNNTPPVGTVTAEGAGILEAGRNAQNSLWLKPLSPAQTGSWRLEYQAPAWLKYNWSGSASGFDENPLAEAMFGRYRGNPRRVYWQEILNGN